MLKNKKENKDISNKALLRVIDRRFDNVDKKFELVDKKLEQTDKRLEQVDKRLELLDKKINKEISALAGMINRRFDDSDKKIDKIENIIVLDYRRRIERLEFDVKILKDVLAV